MDIEKSSAPAQPSTKEHNHQDERPHVCNDGWVTIGQIVVVDDDTGEEREAYALYLCRKCAERS